MHPPSEDERWVRQAMNHYYGRDAEALERLVRQLAQRLPPDPAMPPVPSPTPAPGEPAP